MASVGPIRCDDRAALGSSVVASREPPADRVRPRPAPVVHDFAAIVLYVGGRARMEQKGRWNLEGGDVLLVPAGEPHRMLHAERAEHWGLAFRAGAFVEDGASALLEPFERVRGGASPVVHVPSGRQAFLEGLFRELAESDPRAPRAARDAVQKSLLTLILAEIERAGRDENAPLTNGGSVVADSLRFIERNCLRRLTLNDVAAAVGRSPTYLTTALTRATGKSASDWIIAGRMAEARRLLLHSDERIDIVAERVGYADATHFIRMFRRTHGATPAAWKAAQRAR